MREVYTAICDFKYAGLPSYDAYWTRYTSGATSYPSYLMRDGGHISASIGNYTRQVICVAL